jgi:hypothetical protein
MITYTDRPLCSRAPLRTIAETLIEELHGGMEDLRLQKWSELLAIQQQQLELLRAMLDRPGAARA